MSEEQTKPPTVLKKQNSYTYWVDEKSKSKNLPVEQQPQKVQPPVVMQKKSEGPSPWNNIGTWEQKKVPMGEFRKRIEELINEWLETKEEAQVKLSEIDLDGEIEIIYKRGKKNVMYEIKGNIKFEKGESKGKVKIDELTDHGDREYRVKGDKEIRDWVMKHSELLMKMVEGELSKFKQ